MTESKYRNDRLQLHNECSACGKSFDALNVISYLAILALFLKEIPFFFHNLKAHKGTASLKFTG
ncbi:hypothetical protein A3D76_06795 [Candidatus Roizmanbacteria bacterium RIFCSPHIGHO2_02_FULL_37_9b]|nr:MAG: hypothetical protein A3D76_06795 [Candidatus Roizmanbacteria bacterium RIFCSPHIGHO2_02_FULL_37_9b]